MATVLSPQRETALASANVKRLERSGVGQDVRVGLMSLADALDHWSCDTARIEKVLAWQHGWGPRRASRLLGRLNITPTRRVGDLTGRQRAAIVKAAETGVVDDELGEIPNGPSPDRARVTAILLLEGWMTLSELRLALGRHKLTVKSAARTLDDLLVDGVVARRNSEGFVIYGVVS